MSSSPWEENTGPVSGWSPINFVSYSQAETWAMTENALTGTMPTKGPEDLCMAAMVFSAWGGRIDVGHILPHANTCASARNMDLSQPALDPTQDARLPQDARQHMRLFWPYPPVGRPQAAEGSGQWMYFPVDLNHPEIWEAAHYVWQPEPTSHGSHSSAMGMGKRAHRNGWVPAHIWSSRPHGSRRRLSVSEV